MAAQRLVLGVLREFWQENAAQGPGAQVVSTGIRLSAGQLCRVQGLLTVTTPTGSPIFTAVPSVVNKRLVVTVTNTAAGGNLGTWTLDVRLIQSSDQANQGATAKSLGTTGYIQVANGATTGLAGAQTLVATYAVGASAADQTMTLDTAAKGGGIIVDGSTAAMTTGYSLEVKQNALHDVPFAVSRRINQVPGANITFDRARGTYALPLDVQTNDLLGSIDFVGHLGGTGILGVQINSVCLNAGAGGTFALDVLALAGGVLGTAVLQIGSSGVDGLAMKGYGNNPVFTPGTNHTGQLGDMGQQWASLHVDTANVYANVCLGGVTPGVNAFQTVVLPVAATVPPVASVGMVHVYAQLFPVVENKSALAWSQDEPVKGVAFAADSMIPVVVNGIQYLLLAQAASAE